RFSEIAKPLNELLKKENMTKGNKLKWTESQQEAFDTLKQKLISAPILTYPDFEKPFVLMTDGSAHGLGAVLAQIDEKGKEKVVAYASSSLVGAQKNYSATELEMLAVVWAIEYFRQFLEYRHFTLLTDHLA